MATVKVIIDGQVAEVEETSPGLFGSLGYEYVDQAEAEPTTTLEQETTQTTVEPTPTATEPAPETVPQATTTQQTTQTAPTQQEGLFEYGGKQVASVYYEPTNVGTPYEGERAVVTFTDGSKGVYGGDGAKQIRAAQASAQGTQQQTQPEQPAQPTGDTQQATQQPAQTHTVQSGDTVSSIAAQYGVTPDQVTGYRSGDPNLIYPGEQLTIGGQAPQDSGVVTVSPAGQDPFQIDTSLLTEEQAAGVMAARQSLENLDALEATGFDMSQELPPGVTIQDILENPEKVGADGLLKSMGIDRPNEFDLLNQNPMTFFSDIMAQMMEAMNVPSIQAAFDAANEKIQELQVEMNGKIADVNENPWISEALRSKKITAIQKEYEQRIESAEAKMDRAEAMLDRRRDDARYMATQALNGYYKEREFQADQLQRAADNAYRASQMDLAERKFALEVESEEFDQMLKVADLQQKAAKSAQTLANMGIEAPSGVSAGAYNNALTIMNPLSDATIEDFPTAERGEILVALNYLKDEARKRGDTVGELLASAGGTAVDGTTIASLNKALNAVGLMSDINVALNENFTDKNTGPIVGWFRNVNPYDVNAQELNSLLNAVVPGLARGVYGEVGVLTDKDIEIYKQTLPNIRQPEDLQRAMLGMTLRVLQRGIEHTLATNAAGGRDVSGFADQYEKMSQVIDQMMPTTAKEKIKIVERDGLQVVYILNEEDGLYYKKAIKQN